ETNPIHTYALNGVYNVCLSVTGAGGSDTYCQDVTVAANGSAPSTDFSFELIGLTAIFTDLSTNAPADWYWDFGDGAISGLQNPVHTYAVEDIYNVCLTTTNDFGFNTYCQVVDLTTGILDQGVQYLTLYPNPAADYTIITGNMATADISTLTLVNALGQEINTASIVTYTNGTITINTQQLAAGAYTISLINEGTHFIGKFVKL
ncbi:MAG: PKD domain-containing protein, partial [Chitinophagales bacterium]